MDRGFFGGPIGLNALGEGAAAAAIRRLSQGNHAYAFAGAGIVQESDADEEWSETGLKMQPVQRGLRLRRMRDRETP